MSSPFYSLTFKLIKMCCPLTTETNFYSLFLSGDKMIPKMKLKVTAIEILVTELLPAEMMAIYLMASGSAMPGKVSKEDLTKVIRILCKKLDWIEDEEDDTIIPSAILSQSLVIDEETEDHLLNGLKENGSNHEEENVDPILT